MPRQAAQGLRRYRHKDRIGCKSDRCRVTRAMLRALYGEGCSCYHHHRLVRANELSRLRD